MSSEPPVRWGILGPGKIARDFWDGAQGSSTGRIVAIGARRPNDPALKERYTDCHIHPGYQALIDDPSVDALYIALPHALHAEWAIKAANAGKHVLCEKPIATSRSEAEAMFAAARANATFMGEAYMYRHHPLTERIIELIREGAIGKVRVIKASFGFAAPNRSPETRLFAPELGGGAILDLGCYMTSVVRMVAGCADGDFLDFSHLKALAHVGPTGVDEHTSAVGGFVNGVVADMSCAITVRQDNVLHIAGTVGRIEIDQFWWAGGKQGGVATIRLFGADGTREVIEVAEPRHLYSFEFEAANDAIRAGAHEFGFPGTSAADSIGNMAALDHWRLEARC